VQHCLWSDNPVWESQEEYEADFGLKPVTEPGLSIVVPWSRQRCVQAMDGSVAIPQICVCSSILSTSERHGRPSCMRNQRKATNKNRRSFCQVEGREIIAFCPDRGHVGVGVWGQHIGP
jgi:hypothetical protein